DEFSFDKTPKVTTNKGSKGNKMRTLEDKSSNYKNSNIAISKVKKGHIIEDESSDNKTTIKKAKNGQIINDFSSNNAEKEPLKQLKRSRQQFSDDTKFSSDDPEQLVFKKKNINYQKIPSFLHIPKKIWHGYV
ncbi:5425_t:CDS:2, partial [Cetraspora pellucida]